METCPAILKLFHCAILFPTITKGLDNSYGGQPQHPGFCHKWAAQTLTSGKGKGRKNKKKEDSKNEIGANTAWDELRGAVKELIDDPLGQCTLHKQGNHTLMPGFSKWLKMITTPKKGGSPNQKATRATPGVPAEDGDGSGKHHVVNLVVCLPFGHPWEHALTVR